MTKLTFGFIAAVNLIGYVLFSYQYSRLILAVEKHVKKTQGIVDDKVKIGAALRR